MRRERFRPVLLEQTRGGILVAIHRDRRLAAFRHIRGVSRLLLGNYTGYEAVLKSVDHRSCAAAMTYRLPYQAWLKSHTLGERFRFADTRKSERPFTLDFPPGELRQSP